MKRIIKYSLIGIVTLLVLIQFYRPSRNLYSGPMLPVHFVKVFKAPKEVARVLAVSCSDCHSNNTYYPWYSEIQPVRYFLDGHINEGKEELNFSEYGTYSKRRQKGKLKGMAREIESGDMPLSSYTLIHRNAILSGDDKKMLLSWISKVRDSLDKVQ